MMTEGTRVIAAFPAVLRKGRLCDKCGKHLPAGASAMLVKRMKVKQYPVKGLMGFIVWNGRCSAHGVSESERATIEGGGR